VAQLNRAALGASGFALVAGLLTFGAPASRAGGDSPPFRATVVLGGDVMFGRWRDGQWQGHREPATLERLRAVARPADLALANLETALCPRGRIGPEARRSRRFRLTAPPAALGLLRTGGIDVVTVANNHALDCGRRSLPGTVRAVRTRGMRAAGAPQLTGIATHDLGAVGSAHVLATTVHPATPARGIRHWPRHTGTTSFHRFLERVRALRARRPKTLLIASVHWGDERAPAASAWQRMQGRALLESGADLVMGHGAHVFHAVERYEGGALAYGLGNLHFDMQRSSTRRRAVVRVTVQGNGKRRPSVTQVKTVELSQ
jgi:poly-gamma-glutamate synthesis protein (capsule biosynthesis protein)